MMELENILNSLAKIAKTVKRKKYSLEIKADTAKINEKFIHLLYFLLNHYEDFLFITIENVPYCLMPDAIEHLIYRKTDRKKYSKDQLCKLCHFNNNCPGWQESINTEKIARTAIKNNPKEIVIEVTEKCNLSCKTCTFTKDGTGDIEFKKVQNVIKECKVLDIKAIRFTGGEPLLNKNIAKILKSAKGNGLYVLLNTNATLANDTVLELLSENVDNVLISLQGFNGESDKFLTNSNLDFNNKIANIIKIKSRVPIARIGTVISRTLIENFESYFNLLKKMGIDNWELYRPMLKASSKEFTISQKDILRIMKYLFILKEKGMKVKIANPVPFCITKNADLSLATLLGAIADDGHSRIVYATKGYFKPSYFIDINLGDKIKQAWQSSYLKKINSLSYLPSKCKQCHHLKWCMGGSRVLAKKANNSYFCKDPLISL